LSPDATTDFRGPTIIPWRDSLAGRVATLLTLALILASFALTLPATAQTSNELPPVALDALDPSRWSVSELRVAPGQTILVTNRGVQRHTFTVREWGIDVELPTLQTIEIVVPPDAQPGATYAFFCSEPGHRALGQEGTVTIVTAEEILANQDDGSDPQGGDRILLETSDEFTWSLPAFEAYPGQFIEISNSGVIEHHFVVDEWNINETISPGEIVLVQVPDDAVVGQQYVFYCSIPGHQPAGEEGIITVIAADAEGRSSPGSSQQRANPDLGRFLPDATALDQGWELVRTGDARAVVPEFDSTSSKVFPGTGRGATYVGPSGSRATVLILPFAPYGVPSNQVEDAVLSVQLLMMAEWETDLSASESLSAIEPPAGCDEATRTAGVTRVYTLPAGSTVCQLRSAGIAIFVTIEGDFGTWSSVEAADQIILRLLELA
jgi:hypothetical protein